MPETMASTEPKSKVGSKLNSKAEAVAVLLLLEKYEIVRDMLQLRLPAGGAGTPQERLQALAAAIQ